MDVGVPEISVVVPLYNEIENIGELNTRLIRVMETMEVAFELIFVDDGSTDGTFNVLEELSKMDHRIRVVSLKVNKGQSAAMAAGFSFVTGRKVVTLDGDMQNPPEEIPRLLEGLDDDDVVCGWRHDRKDPPGKKLASGISNFLARRLTGVDIHDFGCTLRAYKVEVIKDLELMDGWHRYIPALAAWKGYRVGERIVGHGERIHGETKYGLSRLWMGFVDILNISFMMGRFPRPLYVLGAVSFVFMVMAGGFIPAANLIASGALMAFGIFILTLGLLSEIRMRDWMEGARDREAEFIKGTPQSPGEG